jgi:lambda family phage portal protein
MFQQDSLKAGCKMKRTFMDKVVGFFSPEAETKRLRARAASEQFQRSYDAAFNYQTDDWSSATTTGPNAEIKGAQGTIRDKARDAVRNNSYAEHIVDVIVGDTIGTGIEPKITGRDAQHTLALNEAWKIWGESTLCDAEGVHNHYALQALAMRAIVEGGEVLARKLPVSEPLEVEIAGKLQNISGSTRIQLMESDLLDASLDKGKIKQGVEVDNNGRRVGYYLFSAHPAEGEKVVSKKVDALEVIHSYRPKRIGQIRGVSWLASVLRPLEDLKSFQEASLIRQKIAACFAAFIETDGSDEILSADDRREKRSVDAQIEPGTMRYLAPGEKVSFGTPPSSDGQESFNRDTLRKVAVGPGITYEGLTNDYSQVNYSSARMGKINMTILVEQWRWLMFIPQFCEPTFKWFLEWANLNLGIDSTGVKVEWCPPVAAMLDPIKEIEGIKRAIRIGVKTLPRAIKEQGYDPEEFFKEAAETNKKLDELGLAYDSDPRKMSSVGFAQAGDSYDKLNGIETTGDDDSGEEDGNEDPADVP